jgi:hypothetical protein
MEQQAERTRYDLYLLGFLLSAAALFVGNLLGFILTSIWGWSNLEYDRPGGVALSALQGAIGVFLALYGSEKFFGKARYTDFWMRAFVWLASGIMAAMLLITAFAGGDVGQFLDWRLASFIASIGTIEVTRRYVSNDISI